MADALGIAQGRHARMRRRQTRCVLGVLRRFRDAVADFPEAQMMLARIQDLYRIDASAKDLVERMRATESILGT